MQSKKTLRRNRIRKRIRRVISGNHERPRLSVYRSNKQIYAQLIDDVKGHTIVAASSAEITSEGKMKKTEAAMQVGKLIAEKAIRKGITRVVFDRGGYLYHGRVKSLAEGARSAGLKF
jgi:large subunit ribosomal protein L18